MQNLKFLLNLVAGILFGLFLAALVWVVTRNPSGQAVMLRPAPTERPIIVHVTGAVPRPGVYALPKGARVQDAVSAAGGFLAEADKASLNLAQELEDGQRLDIPYAAGFSPVIPTAAALPVSPEDTDLVNINTASAFELETLPGIGPTLAQQIVKYREQNGPFLSTEDIINVSGVGPGTYERIKDLITVGP
ncbi:MAG: ComEA family DNA-binding protein [Chloroflexota bacterium]|jgi:competence protein ComEA